MLCTKYNNTIKKYIGTKDFCFCHRIFVLSDNFQGSGSTVVPSLTQNKYICILNYSNIFKK